MHIGSDFQIAVQPGQKETKRPIGRSEIENRIKRWTVDGVQRSIHRPPSTVLIMNRLEKYIQENRLAFDTEVPSLKVWANIDRQLDQRPKPKVVWMHRVRAMAAVAILTITACAIGFYMGANTVETRTLADISPEHEEMERYFNQQIDNKMAQLVSYKQDGFVKDDFQELDAIYNELRQELEKAPVDNDERVIQAMIKNYQTKIDILEQVLEKVQTTEQTNLKTEEDEVSI